MKRNYFNLLLLLFATLVIYVLYLTFFDATSYREFIDEDGFVEYGSALSWFFSALCVFVFYIRNYGFKIKFNNVYYLFIILIFIVFCGEEISWGQRVFHIETPKLLSEINVQNEITLHNIGHISIFSNLFFIGNLFFFYFLKKTKVKFKFLQRFDILCVSKRTILIFSVALIVWVIVGIRFGTLGFHPFSVYAENYYNQMDDEIFEFLSAISFLCYSFFDVLLSNRSVKSLGIHQ